jgi:Domain of unknown function (DUF4276)
MPREVHIHVEEPSMEAYLQELLPRIALPVATPRIIVHSGKQKLLKDVPIRLSGYSRTRQEHRPLNLILVDRDDNDCKALKAILEEAAVNVGLRTKTGGGIAPFDVVNRIVVRELEAWHFGDVAGLAAEYPGVQTRLVKQAKYRDPDAIAGRASDALLRVLQAAGHYKGVNTLPKIETARRMGQRVDFTQNRSESFNQFIRGLRALVEQQHEAA